MSSANTSMSNLAYLVYNQERTFFHCQGKYPFLGSIHFLPQLLLLFFTVFNTVTSPSSVRHTYWDFWIPIRGNCLPPDHCCCPHHMVFTLLNVYQNHFVPRKCMDPELHKAGLMDQIKKVEKERTKLLLTTLSTGTETCCCQKKVTLHRRVEAHTHCSWFLCCRVES